MVETKYEHENRQIFWNNLLALSFEPKVAENEHRIEFNKDMFLKPNHKGFEVVMHFLFYKLDAQQAKEKFRDCYPIQDKKGEQLFRKACKDWLQNIPQNITLISHQQGLVYLLQNKGSRKFCRFLRDFSTYVLYETAVMKSGYDKALFSLPSSLQGSHKYCRTPNYEFYNVNAALCTNSLVSIRNKLQRQYNELRSIGQNLTRTYRHFRELVKGQLQDVQITTEGSDISAISKFIEESDEEMNLATSKVCEKKSEVEIKWSLCEESFQNERNAWDAINNVLFKKRKITILNKDSLALTLPEKPFSNCDAQLEKNRKLSLAGMHTAWAVILDQLCRNPELGKLQRIAWDQQKISEIWLQVGSVRSLISKLDDDMIPSQNSLNKSLIYRLMETEMHSLSTLELGRELMCPTPPLTSFNFSNDEGTPSPYLSLRALPCNQSASMLNSGVSKKRAQLSRNRRIATTDRRQAHRIFTEEQSFLGNITFPEHEFGCGDTKRCDSPLSFMKCATVRHSCDGSTTQCFDIRGDVSYSTPSPKKIQGKKFNATEEFKLHLLDTPLSSFTELHENGACSEPQVPMTLKTNQLQNEPSLVQLTQGNTPVNLRLLSMETLFTPTPPLPLRLQRVIQQKSGTSNVPSDSDPEPLESLQISLVDSPFTSPSPQTPPFPPRIWKFLQEQTDKVDDI